MKLLLPLSEVPLGAHVTKPTGEKLYRVFDELTFYNSEGGNLIRAEDGCRYLVDPSNPSKINVYSGDREVRWQTDFYGLSAHKMRDWTERDFESFRRFCYESRSRAPQEEKPRIEVGR